MSIQASVASDVRISNCNVDASDGYGSRVGNNFDVTSVVATAAGAERIGLEGTGTIGLRLRNCKLTGTESGVKLNADPQDVDVYACEIRGVNPAVFLWAGDNVRFEACHIVGFNGAAMSSGVYVDGIGPPGVPDVLFLGCEIESIGGSTAGAAGVLTKLDDPASKLRFVDCTISARCTNTNSGGAWAAGWLGALSVIGGSLTSSAAAQKETEVWDVVDGVGQDATVWVSGTRFSKAKGPIFPAGRPVSTIQRTVNVSVPDADAILAATPLTSSEQEITTGITNPDVYRVLSVTGNQAGMNQDVYIIGTNFGGERITDKITLNGASTVGGVKPFMTVTKIILPPQGGTLRTVSVGTSSKLGLHFPISAPGDVLNQARRASGAGSYTLANVGPVDATYATVDVSATLGAGDSFEWAVLASQ